MPEGPETRRVADQLRRAVAGKRLNEVWFAFPHLQQDYAEELSRARVHEVEARGKALLTRFDNELVVYSHNQLYGRWFFVKPDSLPRTQRQLRFSIKCSDRWALLYSASDIEVVGAAHLAEHPFLSKLGPDLLDERLAPSDFARHLERKEFRRRSLAVLYLDQAFAAGSGNYLRSEILFEAGLSPRRTPASLTQRERHRLAEASLEVARRSYRTGGITNLPERVAELKREGARRSHYRHQVFGRSGRDCYRCGTAIIKEELNGRRLYLCTGCQV